MKFEMERFCLRIVPETPIDEAYLEEVLGLRRAGDEVPLRRENAMGLSCWAYTVTCRPSKPSVEAPHAD